MTETIQPALTAEDWRNTNGHPEHCVESEAHDAQAGVGSFAAVIALANAALADSDPRKITRERVRMLRALRVFVQTGVMPSLDTRADLEDALTAHIDALESYIPPA